MIWRIIAWIVSRPTVAAWLIARAKRTPYCPIMSKDGKTLYMDRWWLFNPYRKDAEGDPIPARWSWLPSVRVHHICVPDGDRHLHNHPWRKARTIILGGWYGEECLPDVWHRRRAMGVGDTQELRHEHFHRIATVSPGGVYTLFFTWGIGTDWGFLMDDGSVMPWREYVEKHEQA